MKSILFILLPLTIVAQNPDYEAMRSGVAKMHLLGYTGAGVKIAVLDVNFRNVGTPNVSETWVAFDHSYNFIDDNEDVDGTSDHGNFVLTAIKSSHGIATGAEVHALKAQTDDGTPNETAMIAALQYCIDNDIDIINISTQYSTTNFDAKVLDCIAAGIVVVAASGNSETLATTAKPAALTGVVAVNAINENFQAELLNVNAPEGGHGITIAASGSDCYVIGRAGVLVTSNGTSFSAPWIVGAFALYKERYPNMSNHACMQLLIDRAIKQPNTTYFGAGRPTF